MGHSHNNNRGFVLFQVTWVWKTICWDQTALMELRSYDDVPCVHWFCPPQSTHTVIPDPIFQRLTNIEWMKLKSDRLTWWWIIPSLNLNVWLYFRIKFELQWTWSLVYSFWVHDNEWMSSNDFGRVTGSILQLRLPLGRESVSRINSDWLSPSYLLTNPGPEMCWHWCLQSNLSLNNLLTLDQDMSVKTEATAGASSAAAPDSVWVMLKLTGVCLCFALILLTHTLQLINWARQGPGPGDDPLWWGCCTSVSKSHVTIR